MKYYAIRTIDGKTINKIITSWDECKELVQGKHSEYKSFKNEQDAKDYIKNYAKESKEEDVLNSENHIYYVDGSYMNNTIGWSYVHVLHNKEQDKAYGNIKESETTSRNITGELTATLMAVNHALINGFKKIYIVNDYAGISCYPTGAWKPKTEESKRYKSLMDNYMKLIDINFIKVKGHSNNKFNDIVDGLAKKGTTI